MKIITVAIQKGGTGKTTTAAAMVSAAVYKGLSVLAIDLDPQGNFSLSLGADTSRPGSYELLTGADPAELVQHLRPGMDMIPASWGLSTFGNAAGAGLKLDTALKDYARGYHVVIIDTPPTSGILQYNALQASTDLLIPLQADIYNLQSLYQIVDVANMIRKSNPRLQIAGYVFTQVDNRSTISKQMQQNINLKAAEMGLPYLGAIRGAVAVKEAAAMQEPLFDYAPNSKPAQDYLRLFESLVQIPLDEL